MPPKPQWITRIAEITQLLPTLTSPVIDRRIVEQLFGVKPRRANDLMRRFGGYVSGNVYLIDRDRLLAALRSVSNTADVSYEIRRRQRLGAELAKLDRHARAMCVRLPVQVTAWPDLPGGVSVGPGTLTVRFREAEELFAKLYGLAELAAVDFERMRKTLEGTR